MNVSQLILSVSAVVVAVSAAVIALRVHVAVNHLRMTAMSVNSLNLWLFNHFAARKFIRDVDPTHHVVLEPPPVAAVWIWSNNSWQLRSEEVSECKVGPSPSRTGKFEGECVIAQSLIREHKTKHNHKT